MYASGRVLTGTHCIVFREHKVPAAIGQHPGLPDIVHWLAHLAQGGRRQTDHANL